MSARGDPFRDLLTSEVELSIREACLSAEDEQIARAYCLRHDAMEDIAAEVMYHRDTVSRRLRQILPRVETAARKLGIIEA